MSENPRIDELRRRVDKDPTSIAFAQLAEEYRRVGDFEQAVKVCREGLARHPGYLSAQVTLGRALMELEQYEEAGKELEAVLRAAPDNLAAIRALADIHQRRGDAPEPPKPPIEVEPPSVEPLPPPLETAPLETEPPLEIPPLETPRFEMPPLDEPAPVDFSLDVTMPSFDNAEGPRETPSLSEDDVPSLEALDSLTLDLPPMPDFSNFSLDTDFALDLPEPTFPEAPLDQLEAPPPAPATAHDDPVIEELQQWLAAIVADRSESR
jgi:hypothetical protein